jgi:hypothetical protein
LVVPERIFAPSGCIVDETLTPLRAFPWLSLKRNCIVVGPFDVEFKFWVGFEVAVGFVVEFEVEGVLAGWIVIWVVVCEFRYPVFEAVAVIVQVVVFVKLAAVKIVL